jgi:hypothetical protein
MTPEQRLDRLERIVKLMVRAGMRERRETREKINALIDAQLRTEAAMERMAQAQANLAQAQTNTDEKLDAFISTVEKLISERRNGNS